MFKATRYSLPARLLHWAVVLCVFALFPLGMLASSRASANIWDEFTNTLYAWHKSIGFTLLILMVLRLLVRLRGQVPPYPPSMASWETSAAKGTHHLLYFFLFAVPLLGWAGVTAFPALEVFAGKSLPAMPFIPKGEPLALSIFNWHAAAAYTLGALILLHIAAALRHAFVKKDGMVDRIWFG